MEQGTGRGRPPVILLVDDEEAVRLTARRRLWSAGYVVIEASNGGEALAVLETDGVVVDAIVSDISMPHMNGIDLANLLYLRRPGWPILLASGDAVGAVTKFGSPPDGIEIVNKPFEFDDLLRRLKSMTGRAAG